MVTVVTVTVYMSFSGYMGISVNALIQGWIMLIGALLIAPIALGRIGGMGEVLSRLTQIDPKLLKEIPGTFVLGKFFFLYRWYGD